MKSAAVFSAAEPAADPVAVRSALASPGALLRAWRTAMGWTQGDVARAVRVTRAAVTSWEAGARRIPPRALEDLDFAWVTGGSLTGLVRAVGSRRSTGFAGPRHRWGHVFPAESGPVWAWTRPADGDRVAGSVRLGLRELGFEGTADRDGLVLALPGTGAQLSLRVTLNAPGWTDFGRGTVPSWLKRPVRIIPDSAAEVHVPADPAGTGARPPGTPEERVALHRQLREARAMSQADAASAATAVLASGGAGEAGRVTRQQVRNYEEGRASRVPYLPALLDMAYDAFGWSCREPVAVTRVGTDTFEAAFPAWWAGPVSVTAVSVSDFPDPGFIRLRFRDRVWQCPLACAPTGSEPGAAVTAEHVRTPDEPPLTVQVPAGWRVQACMGQVARPIDADLR